MNFLLYSNSKGFQIEKSSCNWNKSFQHPTAKFYEEHVCDIRYMKIQLLNVFYSHDTVDISENMFSHTLLNITSSCLRMKLFNKAIAPFLKCSLCSTGHSHTDQYRSCFGLLENFSFKLLKSSGLIFVRGCLWPMVDTV